MGRGTGRRPERRVLLVDPRQEHLDYLAWGLRQAGYQVVALTRYEAACPLSAAFRPDAVVIAAIPPELTGCATARRLRELSRGALPIFYVLDAPDPLLRERCLGAGQGIDALSRPVDPRELEAKIRAQLSLLRSVARQAKSEGACGQLRDRLTGLPTRRLFLALVERELKRVERFGGEFSVLAVLLTGLRLLRRERGHRAAERVLRYAAVILARALRESDALARVGEEVVAVLLPGTAAERVSAVEVRIASQLELSSGACRDEWALAALALGSASFPDSVGSPEQLLEAALSGARRWRHGPLESGADARARV